MNKKISFSCYSAVMAGFLSIGMLAGCANSTSGSSSQKPETITLWYGATGVSEDAIKKAVQQFETENPNIKVNPVYEADLKPGGGQKLLAAIAGGSPPDVVYFDRFQIGAWAAQGALTDLTDRIKKDGVDPHSFYDSAWNECIYNNKIYGLPLTTDSRVLFYNKDQFKSVGLDPNKPPKTIQELEQDADKLTVKEGGNYKRLGFVPWLGQGASPITWGWVFGGDFYNTQTGKVTANDPKVVAALQWEQDYANRYNINDITSLTSSGTQQQDPFISGEVSMEVANSSLVANIKKFKPDLNYGVAPIPTPTGDHFTTWSGGFSFVIPKGAKHSDGAWQMMNYFSGPKGQEVMAGVSLSVLPQVNDKLYANDPVLKQFVDLLKVAHWRPVIPQSQLLWNELGTGLDLAIHNKETPKQILDDVTNKVNAAQQAK